MGLTSADLDAALAGRALVISWLCRGTLHLVSAEDYFWLHDLTVPPLHIASRRRLAQEGVTPGQADRAAELISSWLTADGPLARGELRERLRTHGIPCAGQAFVHILFHATLQGLIIRGPMKGRQQAFVLTHDWLGPRPAERERGEAVAELVRRYLTGHAPATEADIARWANLPLRDIRAGLQRIASLISRRGDGSLALAGAVPGTEKAPPRLLGAFDPLLVGWRDRSFLTGDHEHRVVTGGIFRPFILVDGYARGLWRIERGSVLLEPFAPLSKADGLALEADAEDVRRYLALGGSDRA